MGTYEIAKICQVTPATVGRWVEEGKIPYFTTGGGHRRVWNTDVVSFLRSLNIPIPTQLHHDLVFRILIVDDDASVRKSIVKILVKNYPHVEIHEAKDGFEAGHKTGSLKPSLVILDLRLPALNGIEVCKLIRKDPNLKDTKILAITGFSSKESKSQILKAGADDFLAKPFQPDILLSKVKVLAAR